MTPAETAGRPGKADDGRAHTREVKLACLFTQAKYDEKGRPVADPTSASYLASFRPAEAFGALAAAEARRRGAEVIRQLVVIGDGAKWIWTLAGDRFPQATQIVDLYHAREHLHDLAAHLAFIVPDPAAWLAGRLADLDAGTSPRSSKPPAPTRSPGSRPPNWTPRSATSRPTPTGCATPGSASWACSSAPAPSRAAARTSSAPA